MKLTNLHIFLIILLALVLCSTLGGKCSAKEGYEQRYGNDTSSTNDNPQYKKYNGYKGYYNNLDNAADNNSYNYRRNHHRNHHQQNHQHEGYKNENYYNDELNVGDNYDPSGMYSGSYKRSHNRHTDYNRAYRRERQTNNMFDSVSTGAINGSLFNSANSYSNNDNYDNTNDNNDNYDNKGVRRHEIPAGDEDLYILKSQIVPPICPACPKCPSVNCDDKCGSNKCPPCPACARCPEPQFECKKVPNYSSANIMGNLPIPWADKLDIN